MALSTTKRGDIGVLTLTGSIDSKTAPGIREGLLAALQESTNVIINMTAVDYLSSAGLRLLLLAYRDITAKNGKILLVGVSDEIQDVMSNTGFIKFFQLTATEAEALAILG